VPIEVALYASPFLLLAALLLCGRFVGEDEILQPEGQFSPGMTIQSTM
jgi:hypothetical protein